MKVGFGSMDWSRVPDPATGHPTPGGSGWYRCHLPHRALLAAGVSSCVGRLVFDRTASRFGIREWDDTDHFDVDLVVMQRWMLADLPDDIRAARSTGQLVVQDIDDWFFGLATQNVAHRAYDNPLSNLAHYRKILAASNLVIASTPYLASRIAQFQPHVTVVRNHVDVDRWPVTCQRDRPVLGWAGATPWRSGDLETLRGVIPQVLSRHGAGFHHSGHIGGDWSPAHTVLGLSGPAHTHTPMVPIGEWPDQFSHFDVGIVPLSDRPFNVAKSYIKGLEYAAAGIPFVAQSTPEYKRLAVDHGIGRIASRPRDWIRHLDALLSMSALERSEEARRNRLALRDQHLTVDDLAEHWLEGVTAGLPATPATPSLSA